MRFMKASANYTREHNAPWEEEDHKCKIYSSEIFVIEVLKKSNKFNFWHTILICFFQAGYIERCSLWMLINVCKIYNYVVVFCTCVHIEINLHGNIVVMSKCISLKNSQFSILNQIILDYNINTTVLIGTTLITNL